MLAILVAAHSGAVRFNEFRQVLGGLPARTLAARLTELEEAGLLQRVVVDARPPRVEYRLTGRGERLTADISGKISSSINLRNVLQTAVEELGHVLPGSEVVIQFETGKNKKKAAR